MVWAYMSAKPASSRSWTSAVWNAFMSWVSGPASVSMASAVRMRSRMARASSARRSESCFEVVITSRWRSLKAARQRSRQASGSRSSSGHVRWSVSSRATASKVERRVEVVPSEHLEGRQVVAVLGLREVGEGDPAFLALAVVGDEEQVVGGPGLALGLVGRGALLEPTWPRMRRSATTGRRFGSNLTKKMPQGWPGTSGRRRLISWILAAFFASIPSSSLTGVLEGQLLEVVRLDRPAELVAQVGDELVEAPDAGEAFAVVGRHRLSPRSTPSSSAAAA